MLHDMSGRLLHKIMSVFFSSMTMKITIATTVTITNTLATTPTMIPATLSLDPSVGGRECVFVAIIPLIHRGMLVMPVEVGLQYRVRGYKMDL